MLFNKRNLEKIVHMSEDRINKKRRKDLIDNMTVERATKKSLHKWRMLVNKFFLNGDLAKRLLS